MAGRRQELVDVVEREFADAAGGWFDTASDAEPLIVRPKEIQDGATPSGGAAAAAAILRLAELTGDGRLRDAAERALGQMEQVAAQYRGLPGLARGARLRVGAGGAGGNRGRPGGGGHAGACWKSRGRGFQPHRVLALGDPVSSTLDLLRGRSAIDGRATAFVCHDFACRLPVTEPEELAAELA